MSRTAAALTVLVILGAALFAFLQWQEQRDAGLQLPQQSEQQEAPSAAEPEIHFPVAIDEETAKALPPLDESDATFRSALSELIGANAFKSLFHPQNIVRRIVVTVDNLPREVVADRLRPVQAAEGSFQVARDGDRLVIAPDNARRYAPYISVMERVDAERFGQLYRRFYPLFQAAYRDLGYPKGHFNDRLVAVIDHLTNVPELEGPVTLEQPHVFYRYADPKLEGASAGHKLMWRIGNQNARRVKVKLREIRAVITAPAPTPADIQEAAKQGAAAR